MATAGEEGRGTAAPSTGISSSTLSSSSSSWTQSRSHITRTRTGCLTCRRRRKKCDERKPTCYNCERNNYTCEGYEQVIRWAPGSARCGRKPESAARKKKKGAVLSASKSRSPLFSDTPPPAPPTSSASEPLSNCPENFLPMEDGPTHEDRLSCGHDGDEPTTLPATNHRMPDLIHTGNANSNTDRNSPICFVASEFQQQLDERFHQADQTVLQEEATTSSALRTGTVIAQTEDVLELQDLDLDAFISHIDWGLSATNEFSDAAFGSGTVDTFAESWMPQTRDAVDATLPAMMEDPSSSFSLVDPMDTTGNGLPAVATTTTLLPTPRSFPALINGVDTALERKLFHHFATVLGPALVLQPRTQHNPFLQAVIDIAICDVGIVRLLMSLSACHLLHAIEESQSAFESHEHGRHNHSSVRSQDRETGELKQASLKYYDAALHNHSERMLPFMPSGSASRSKDDASSNCPNQTSSNSPTKYDEAMQGQSEKAFLATMLFCQYDTCEGGCCGAWSMHLDVARSLVKYLPASWTSGYAGRSGKGVLLDWFRYHDSISRLSNTMGSTGTQSAQSACTAAPTVETGAEISVTSVEIHANYASANQDGPILIGTCDGLFQIIMSIIDLEMQARIEQEGSGDVGATNSSRKSTMDETVSSSQPSLSILIRGLELSGQLEAWSYTYNSGQEAVVAESYCWAALVLLHSTVHRCPITDSKVQTAVSKGVEWLDKLLDTDNAQTFALFPIFALGAAAVDPAHRHVVWRRADAYRRWSALGNIRETMLFLSTWWVEVDRVGAKVNWWDWQQFAMDRGFVVTLF